MICVLPFSPVEKHTCRLSKKDLPPNTVISYRTTKEYVRHLVFLSLLGIEDLFNIIVSYLHDPKYEDLWERISIMPCSMVQSEIFLQNEYIFFWSYIISKRLPRQKTLPKLLSSFSKDLDISTNTLFCTSSHTIIDPVTVPHILVPCKNIYCSSLGRVGSFENIHVQQKLITFDGIITNDPLYKHIWQTGTNAIVTHIHSNTIDFWKNRLPKTHCILLAKNIVWESIDMNKCCIIIFDADTLSTLSVLTKQIIHNIQWKHVVVDRIVPSKPSSHTVSNSKTLYVTVNSLVCTICWLFYKRKTLVFISTILSLHTVHASDIIDFLYFLQTKHSACSNYDNKHRLFVPMSGMLRHRITSFRVKYQHFLRCAYTLLCTNNIKTFKPNVPVIKTGTGESCRLMFDENKIYGLPKKPRENDENYIIYNCPPDIPRLQFLYITIFRYLEHFYKRSNIVVFYHKYRIFCPYILLQFPYFRVINGRDIILQETVSRDSVLIVLDHPDEPYMKTYKTYIERRYNVNYYITPRF
jgi:hypothetical protein